MIEELFYYKLRISKLVTWIVFFGNDDLKQLKVSEAPNKVLSIFQVDFKE